MKKKPSTLDLKFLIALGIDVSKQDLHIAYINEDHLIVYEGIANQRTAIDVFSHRLVKVGYTGKIILESTARYHYLLAWRLSEAGLDVRVINPLLSSKHIKGQVRKTKTDRCDAEVLAWMALTEPKLQPPLRIEQKQLQMRQKMGLIQGIEKQIKSISRMLADYEESCTQLTLELSDAETGMKSLLKQIQKQRKALLCELEDMITSSHVAENDVVCLQSLPGFSRMVSQLILTFLHRDVPHAKSWQAFVGLDISVKQSGTYRGRGRLTKRGNPYLRKRLYCAAWGAYMHYPEVRAYYDWLKKQGRTHKEALVIIARKLLGMAFALLKNNTTYDANMAFQLP